jgi:hypothetical protein
MGWSKTGAAFSCAIDAGRSARNCRRYCRVLTAEVGPETLHVLWSVVSCVSRHRRRPPAPVYPEPTQRVRRDGVCVSRHSPVAFARRDGGTILNHPADGSGRPDRSLGLFYCDRSADFYPWIGVDCSAQYCVSAATFRPLPERQWLAPAPLARMVQPDPESTLQRI